MKVGDLVVIKKSALTPTSNPWFVDHIEGQWPLIINFFFNQTYVELLRPSGHFCTARYTDLEVVYEIDQA